MGEARCAGVTSEKSEKSYEDRMLDGCPKWGKPAARELKVES